MANKAARQLKEELETSAKERLAKGLRHGKLRHKKMVDVVKHLCYASVKAGRWSVVFLDEEDNAVFNSLSLDNKNFIGDYLQKKGKEKENFWKLVEVVDKKSSLFESYSLTTFWTLFSYEIFWQQDVEGWEAKTNNTERQFHSLVNHLFAKFPLPKFALNIWTRSSIPNEHINYFFHLAEGKNIRSAENLPFPLSPRMAHAFLSAPDEYTFEQAFIYGQLVSFGAEKRLIKEICENLRREDVVNNEFYSSYYKMLITSPFFDLVHVQPLRDFLAFKRLNNPTYSLKGRNLPTLMQQMEEWHRQLARQRVEQAREQARQRNQARAVGAVRVFREVKVESYKWKATFPQSFEFKEGKNAWHINELTSSEALSLDGSEMRHCVASYASSCNAKRTSILSLTCSGKKIATLEVNLGDHRMVQCRGKCNRRLTEKEQRIVTQWCSKNGVSPGGF